MRLKLPLDIFFILFDLVDPLDILSIGQTCRTLREWSSIRFVWVKALRRVVKTNSLFEPVLNHKDENLPLQHLQHAATSSSRMLKLLERQQGRPDKDRKLSLFSKTSIPFLNQDLYTKKQKLRSFEAQQKFFLVPGGRFIVVLSSLFSRLTVIDVDRYFDKKSRGAKNPPLADYTASIECPGISGKFGVNISLNEDTLLMVIPSSMDRYFLCPDLLVIDRLTDPITYTHVHGVPMHKRMGWTQSKICENRVIRVISLDKSVYIMATGGYPRGPPKEPCYVSPNELVGLGDCRNFSQENSGFDPCSGRLVQLSRNGSSVVIYDYLRRPHV